MEQIKDEFMRMVHNKEIIKSFIIPIIIALLFCYIFSNNQILEADIFVIDQDNSNYSRQFIDKLDASPYIKVGTVINTPVELDLIFTDDRYLAVVSLPKGMEQNIYRNVQSNIGILMDNSVMASISNLRQALTEIVTTENMVLGISKLRVQGMPQEQAAGLLSNLAPQQRLLFNPTGDFINTNVFGFYSLFIMILLLFSAAKIIPRLRQENLFSEAMRHPLALLCRLIPYVLLYMASSVLSLGILKQFGGLRFAGNFGEFLVPLALFIFTTGLLAMLFSWTAKDPGHIASRMLGLVLPSFILSNIIFPKAIMPVLMQYLGQCFPLSWYAKFFRAMGLRGTSLSYLDAYLGGFLIFASIILLLLIIVMLRQSKKEDGEAQKDLENPAQLIV